MSFLKLSVVRPKVSKNRATEDIESKASSHRKGISNTQPNIQSEILVQLLHALVAIK